MSVVPTVVDPQHYLQKVHAPMDNLRLVWIGFAIDYPVFAGISPRYQRRRGEAPLPGLRLLTIANATVSSRVIHVFEHEEWSEQSEATALIKGDIGIAPMPSDRWTLGKCGFKIVQYMASGLPVIASPVGANAELVREGVTGFLPKEPADWPGVIALLCEADANLRSSMGAARAADGEIILQPGTSRGRVGTIVKRLTSSLANVLIKSYF